MVCNITSEHNPVFFISLTVDAGGLIVSVLSIICVATNPSIEATISGILLSYSVANVMGAGMLFYDTITLLCGGEETSGFVITITVLLTVCHLTLLLLFEYLNLKLRWERRVKDFIGLVIISWIISITVGCMNVGTMHHEARIVFAMMILIICIFVLIQFVLVTKKQNIKKRLQEEFKKTFLRSMTYKDGKFVKCHWGMKCLTINLIGFLICLVPWLLNEFREGFESEDEKEFDIDLFIHSSSLMVYSINFYIPSFLCTYLRYKQYESVKWKLPRSRRTTYRYRDTFWRLPSEFE